MDSINDGEYARLFLFALQLLMLQLISLFDLSKFPAFSSYDGDNGSAMKQLVFQMLFLIWQKNKNQNEMSKNIIQRIIIRENLLI